MKETVWQKIEKIAPFAGATANNLRVWKHRKFVPSKWHFPLIEKAAKAGIEISIDELNKGSKK